MSNTVRFTREEVKRHLDNAITYWRNVDGLKARKMAPYYIDAFQSVRSSLFGATLPLPEKGESDG